MKNKHKKTFINDKIYLIANASAADAKALRLSHFERAVLRAICAIPLGQTRSYQWVAKRIGKPGASQAVGQVLKKNPFAPLVPCHRVIRSSGDIGGYAQGEKNKRELLAFEKRIAQAIKRIKKSNET